jgi:hypothetical protein
MRSPIKIDEQH